MLIPIFKECDFDKLWSNSRLSFKDVADWVSISFTKKELEKESLFDSIKRLPEIADALEGGCEKFEFEANRYDMDCVDVKAYFYFDETKQMLLAVDELAEDIYNGNRYLLVETPIWEELIKKDLVKINI